MTSRTLNPRPVSEGADPVIEAVISYFPFADGASNFAVLRAAAVVGACIIHAAYLITDALSGRMKLRQPAHASAPDCTERLTSAIELHSDETSNELSRAADALERIADRLDAAVALHSGSTAAS